MSVRACPVLDGCQSVHPWHGQDECQENVGRPTGDPQDEERCPCVGACAECGGWGSVEYCGQDETCEGCNGSGRAT